jgi:hypothetical protein
MADLAEPQLDFYPHGCPDCAERRVALPGVLPDVADDFAWGARDYDALRLMMLEDLAARLPERGRWTGADLEVVLVEALAAILAQLSDMMDRVAAEGYLSTARRPESVRRLLGLIGYDAVTAAREAGVIGPAGEAPELERAWRRSPEAMEDARAAGPREIRTQRRMVTPDDYAVRLQEHPLIARVTAWEQWSGAWPVVRVAILAQEGAPLDTPGYDPGTRRAEVEAFNLGLGLPAPAWGAQATLRGLLTPFVDAFRMAAQEVWLEEALRVPIFMSISIRVGERHFRSEVRRAVDEALGTGPGGFFRAGRLRFGQDLWESDVLEALTALEGVEDVCLNRFKRLGRQFVDDPSRRIELGPREVAACDNDPGAPEHGYFVLRLNGGRGG